jgi:hypothetical protein
VLSPDQRYVLRKLVERDGSRRSAALFALEHPKGALDGDAPNRTLGATEQHALRSIPGRQGHRTLGVRDDLGMMRQLGVIASPEQISSERSEEACLI